MNSTTIRLLRATSTTTASTKSNTSKLVCRLALSCASKKFTMLAVPETRMVAHGSAITAMARQNFGLCGLYLAA